MSYSWTSKIKSTFFSCLHCGVNSVNNTKALAITFLKLPSELQKSAAKFAAKSHGGELNECIAALDGWLCRIQVPPVSETMNKSSYFFPGTISVTVLMFKQLAMQHVDLFLFPLDVLVAQVTARHFMVLD